MHYMKDTVRQEEADYTPIGALKMFVPGQWLLIPIYWRELSSIF